MLDINQLSEAEKEALKADLLKDEQHKKELKKKEIDNYKQLVHQTVNSSMKELQTASALLSQSKANIFNSFSALVALKKELFEFSDTQRSHTFTNNEGQSIEIGYRVIDGWDDTSDVGIAKINGYVESLATSEETSKLVKMINSLLKKDSKGNLKASRVLELQNLAEEINDPIFTEGVELLRASYKPSFSAYYIEAHQKDGEGKKQNIPLSITSVGFPEGEKINIKF